MELTIGEHAGFCFGVRRAVLKAFECAEKQLPCVTLGPLIHNPQEVERLRRAGIRSVETLDEVKPGETVIIRSHGVTPDVYRQCEARGIPVIDATCPHVAHIHQLVRQYSEHGDAVVIVGEADHPEVVGIAGWARGRVFILPDAQAAEQAEQARNDARHAYEKSVEAASETAAANAASATVLAEQIREMESSVETLKKLDEQEGVFCAPQTGTVESLQLMQGQTSGQVGGSISDPERGYQIRFALEAEDAVQDTAGVTVTVMQGAKSESVKINSSVSQQDGGVVLSAALTGSDWQVGKAELTIRLSETEYDCCLPVSALHSDNGGDFVYSVEERNTILGLQNIVRKVYVEVVERNNELAALRNYTTGAPVVAATTKSLQEGARVRTAG